MATRGCHSCNVDLSLYKDVPYLLTPCAKCALANLSLTTFKRISLFDSDINVDDLLDTIADESLDEGLALPPWIPDRVILLIRRACLANMFVTLSGIILKVLKLAKTAPHTVLVLLMKMQHPDMSYYLIARAVSYPCSKQNVLHHLKHAVSVFPELSKALLIDTRYAPGKGSAIHSIAKMRANSLVIGKLKDNMYDTTEHNTAHSILEINKIFLMPYSSNADARSQEM